jgi:threonine aldolase
LDGARCLNACEVLKIEPNELAKYFDSIYLCFSKGLGAPVGSCLIGDTEFIGKAYKLRK